jgi:2-polyprenyl-3-methyl-5-hydroxy-6-metoxy-1,4-benzoquinol methylase
MTAHPSPHTADAPACLACGSRDSEPYVTVEGFPYHSCRACRAVFLPAELLAEQKEHHAGPEYRLHRFVVETAHEPLRAWHLRVMRRIRPAGRVLEVGCSSGYFLKAMQEAGYTVRGVDVSDACVTFGRNVLGVEIENRDFLDCAGEYDWIVMHQVIEHLPAPAQYLEKARSLLAAGGHLLITTPNLGFVRFTVAASRGRFLGDALDQPQRHCVLFHPSTLAQALGRAGFTVERTGHNPTGYIVRAPWRRWAERLLTLLDRPVGPNMYVVARRS